MAQTEEKLAYAVRDMDAMFAEGVPSKIGGDIYQGLDPNRDRFIKPIHDFDPGRTIGGKVIKLNSEQLRQYKQKLTQAADEVKNIWNTLKNTHVQQLTDSWAGADASAYIKNFRSFDSKVNASVEALDLLARTFERAAKELESTQENIKQFMNSID